MKKHINNAAFGKNNHYWKGDNAGYTAIHDWLRYWYGKPKFCEFCFSKDKKYYEWALIHGEKYSHNREHYMRLCGSCHKKYDYTDETRQKLRMVLLGKKSVDLMIATDEQYFALLEKRPHTLSELTKMLGYKSTSAVKDRLARMIRDNIVIELPNKIYALKMGTLTPAL